MTIISQAVLDIYININNTYLQVDNNDKGIDKLLKSLKKLNIDESQVFVGMEATSGLQKKLVIALNKTRFKIFVCNPEHVWAYRRSLGKRAKTDKIDSRLIAQYLEKIKPQESRCYSDLENQLKELSSRRMQCTEMIATEKKRLKRFISEAVRKNIECHIAYLKAEILKLTKQIKKLIKADCQLLNRYNLLSSIPGVGEIVAITLIAQMPELGEIENGAIAALAGVAPVVRESGTYKGNRKIYGGRNKVRSILYMAAFNAMRVNITIKDFVVRLKNRGKPYKVIIVAVMKKLLTYANSMVKNNLVWR